MSRNQNHPHDIFVQTNNTRNIFLNRSMKVLGYAGSTLIQLFFCASPNIKMMGIDVLLHGANRRVKKCKTQLSTATDARCTCSLKKNFGFQVRSIWQSAFVTTPHAPIIVLFFFERT